MKNAVNWFEIPVSDYERAKKFYSAVIGADIIDHHMDCLLYTSPSPRDQRGSRMPSSA